MWGAAGTGTMPFGGMFHNRDQRSPLGMTQQAPKILKNLTLNETAVRRLEELHRNWRLGRATSQRLMLADCDLRRLDLSLMDFTDGHLVRCNMERANLRGTVFRNATLTGSIFDEADMTGAIFEKADLRGAVFQGSDLTRTVMGSADLRQDFSKELNWELAPACRFRGARLEKTNFGDAKLASVDFAGAFLLDADFSGADMRKASFAAAQLQGVKLYRAELEGADFSLASLDQATGDQVRAAALPIGSAPRLSDAEFAHRLAQHALWVDSLGQAGQRLELDGFDLSGANLRGANLAAARLDHCLLARANLQQAWLLATDLHGANLSEADLSDADLRGADFSESHQRGLVLPGARTGAIPGLSLMTKGLRL